MYDNTAPTLGDRLKAFLMHKGHVVVQGHEEYIQSIAVGKTENGIGEISDTRRANFRKDQRGSSRGRSEDRN